jgi:hypothetical protein
LNPRDLQNPASTPLPSPIGWPARTPEEVAENMLRDPFVAQLLQSSTASAMSRLGVPTYVKGYPAQGYAPPLHDVWLTPVLSGDRVVGVFAASVLPSGNASVDFFSGFAGPFPHPLSRAEAMARASKPSDPAVTADLMWSNLGARQGLLVGLSEPFWRVLTASGSQVLVLHGGDVILANALR